MQKNYDQRQISGRCKNSFLGHCVNCCGPQLPAQSVKQVSVSCVTHLATDADLHKKSSFVPTSLCLFSEWFCTEAN
jgi:hypothetical protein